MLNDADLVLIAEEDLSDPSRDCYAEWLRTYGVRRDDKRLASMRVHLHPIPNQERFQRMYYLPRSVWREMLGKQDDWLNVAAVARWAQMVSTPWAKEFQEAYDADDRIELVRIWNRIDGVRRLVESLCGSDDLAWLDRSLFERGIPVHEPALLMGLSDEPGIDLREESQARTYRPPLATTGSAAQVPTTSTKVGRKLWGNRQH